VKPEIERIAPEDVAHVVAADDDHFEAGFVSNPLQPSWAHFARRTDGESVPGNHERLAAMHPLTKIRH
jgi:hypothetical protein